MDRASWAWLATSRSWREIRRGNRSGTRRAASRPSLNSPAGAWLVTLAERDLAEDVVHQGD